MVFYSVLQWRCFLYSNRPHLSFFSSLNVFLSLDFCHFVFWHIAYLSPYSGLCWISVKSQHLPNPPVPGPVAHGGSCYRNNCTWHHQSSTHTHSRNKGRPTFTPIPTRWPTFPSCIRYGIFSCSLLIRCFSCISKCLTRRFRQIEFLKQTDEYMVHCLLLSLASSLTLNPTTKHICTKNAQ